MGDKVDRGSAVSITQYDELVSDLQWYQNDWLFQVASESWAIRWCKPFRRLCPDADGLAKCGVQETNRTIDSS